MLAYGEEEIRTEGPPFPLYPGEVSFAIRNFTAVTRSKHSAKFTRSTLSAKFIPAPRPRLICTAPAAAAAAGAQEAADAAHRRPAPDRPPARGHPRLHRRQRQARRRSAPPRAPPASGRRMRGPCAAVSAAPPDRAVRARAGRRRVAFRWPGDVHPAVGAA